MKKVVVLGAGPSGLIAALKISTKNYEVTLIDSNSYVGKKILVTGNGRCNYWNEVINIDYYNTDNKELLSNILNYKDDAFNYLIKLGIYPKIKNGLYYPNCNQASSIKNILENAILKSSVNLITDFKVDKILYENNKYKCFSNNKVIEGDILVIASGGCAYPKTGSDGSIINILKSFNIKVNDLNPGLTPIYLNEAYLNKWDGVRCDAKIKLFIDNKFIKEEAGELQLTKKGISGICIFNLSSIASKYIKSNKVSLSIDFLPNIIDIKNWLYERNNLLENKNIYDLFISVLNTKLVDIILEESYINKTSYLNNLTNQEINKLCNNIKDFNVIASGVGDFNISQVSIGGVSLDEVNNNLEVKKMPNMYLVGEALDVDGICGGYNLSFAFISGYVVGDKL